MFCQQLVQMEENHSSLTVDLRREDWIEILGSEVVEKLRGENRLSVPVRGGQEDNPVLRRDVTCGTSLGAKDVQKDPARVHVLGPGMAELDPP